MMPQPNRASIINPSKVGEHPEFDGTIPSQPAENAGGVETVVVSRAEFKGIIAGMLLGDSGLEMHGKHARMQISQGKKQRDFLEWKAKFLKRLTKARVTPVRWKSTRGIFEGFRCQTKSHPLYTRLYELAYFNGVKTVNRTWLNWLTPLGLAIWYMDDGSLCKRRTRNKSGRLRICSRMVHLNTCGFTLEENELLRVFLKERFDLDLYINKASEYKGKEYHRLVGGATRANKLFSIIEPYIIPSMHYKIDMQYEKQPNEGHS